MSLGPARRVGAHSTSTRPAWMWGTLSAPGAVNPAEAPIPRPTSCAWLDATGQESNCNRRVQVYQGQDAAD